MNKNRFGIKMIGGYGCDVCHQILSMVVTRGQAVLRRNRIRIQRERLKRIRARRSELVRRWKRWSPKVTGWRRVAFFTIFGEEQYTVNQISRLFAIPEKQARRWYNKLELRLA